MTQKKKIIVLGRFPPPYDGQSILTERFVSILAEYYDVKPVNTALPYDSKWWSKIFSYVASGSEFADQLSRYPEAAIVWHSISPQFLGHVRDRLTVFRHARGRTMIAVVHWGSFAHLFSSRLSRGSALRASIQISRFVFLDAILSEACSEWLPEKRRVVLPNSIEDALLATDEEISHKQSARNGDTLRLLYLSNMIESKGYLDVVRAAKILKDRGSSFLIDMVGHWYKETDRKSFEKMVQRYDLSEIIVHHGPVSDRDEIKNFHLSADAFLLPTYYPTEAQPISIIEALNAGTPIITTAHGGIPGMVQHERESFIVDARNPTGIAAAIERLYDRDLWQVMSERARTRFLSVYHPDIIREKWIALIEETESGISATTTIE